MKRTKLLFVLLVVSLLVIFSCSEDSTSSDTEPPTVIITYPPNNSEFTQGSDITITTDVTDNKGIKEVRFYINGEFVYLDEEEPYKYEWETGITRDTGHTIYAKAYDTSDNSSTSEVITVTLTEPIGNPPNPPSNPNPDNNANSVSVNTYLSWTCTDPDPQDSLTYDVYFGISSDPPLVNSGQSENVYDPGSLNVETTYYWQIKVNDGNSNTITGDIWQFITHYGGAGTVTDIDGNVYQTFIIGDQEWMTENLKVTHYRNGDAIPNVTDNVQWANLQTGAYCFYDNDTNNCDTYGALYNWYAVNEDNTRGLAPEGWHVAEDIEIMELEMYLGMSQSQANITLWRGSNEGSKLAGGYNSWNNGALRNDPEFDSSGFSFLSEGYRDRNDGNFYNMGSYGYFWSANEYDTNFAWYRLFFCNFTEVNRNNFDKQNGIAVRCVRNLY